MGKPKYIDAEWFIRKIGHDLELSSCMPEDWCRGVRFILYRIKNELAADVVEASRVRQVLLEEFGNEEEEAVDALMERMQ